MSKAKQIVTEWWVENEQSYKEDADGGDYGLEMVQGFGKYYHDKLQSLFDLVERQAEDEGLWFVSIVTAPEAYLQQELRKLHAAVEALKS